MQADDRIRKILVVKLRNIGDVLLTAPLFDALKENYPAAHISALVNAGTQDMLLGHPAVDQVLVYDRSIKSDPWYKRLGRELSFYRKVRREGFDLVLNLTEGDRGALVAFASGAKVRVGLTPKKSGGNKWLFTHLIPRHPSDAHAVERNLRYLAPLGAKASHCRVSFHFTTSDSARVRTLLAESSLAPREYFHAHVTSRWMFKALPHDKVAYLLNRIAEETGLPPVLTCAPDKKELKYLATLLPLLHGPYVDLSGGLSLKQLGALTAGSRFFVGVDSAPMHMAAALDVPVLGIFGPSYVQEWGPWDNAAAKNPYRNRNGVQQTGSHLVLQASRPCVPCHIDGCNGSKVSDCLNFPEEEIAAAIEKFLAATPSKALTTEEHSGPQRNTGDHRGKSLLDVTLSVPPFEKGGTGGICL